MAYGCTIFRDKGGVWAAGLYALADVKFVEGKRRLEPTSVFARADTTRYESFDGIAISIGSSRILVPDGPIDYPFGNGHGKRVTYALGKQVSQEVQY